jgi:hypothetical protein
MKHYLTSFLALLFCSASIKAQSPERIIPRATIPVPVRPYDLISIEQLNHYFDQPYTFDSNGTFQVKSSAFSQSTAIPAQFSNAFLFPKYITEEMKTAAYDRLKDQNRFGSELNVGVMASFSPDSIWKSQGLQFRVGFEQKNIIASSFSKDLFHVLFSGNASYAGETANFDQSSFTSLGYQSFKLGILQRAQHSMFSVDVGLVHGINLSEIHLNSASLYTQPDGSYLDLNWKGSYMQTGRVSNQWKNTPSMGASIDLDIRKQFGSRMILHGSIKDLGFINWNESSTQIKSDTAFRFSGLQFFDVLNLGKDATITIGDSLLNKLKSNELNAAEMRALPALFKVEASRLYSIKNKFITLNTAIQYRMIKGYQPLYSVEVGYVIKSFNSIKLNLMYGGYGGFQTGINYTFLHYKEQRLTIGTYFNEGFLNSKQLSGAGLQLHYQHRL